MPPTNSSQNRDLEAAHRLQADRDHLADAQHQLQADRNVHALPDIIKADQRIFAADQDHLRHDMYPQSHKNKGTSPATQREPNGHPPADRPNEIVPPVVMAKPASQQTAPSQTAPSAQAVDPATRQSSPTLNGVANGQPSPGGNASPAPTPTQTPPVNPQASPTSTPSGPDTQPLPPATKNTPNAKGPPPANPNQALANPIGSMLITGLLGPAFARVLAPVGKMLGLLGGGFVGAIIGILGLIGLSGLFKKHHSNKQDPQQAGKDQKQSSQQPNGNTQGQSNKPGVKTSQATQNQSNTQQGKGIHTQSNTAGSKTSDPLLPKVNSSEKTEGGTIHSPNAKSIPGSPATKPHNPASDSSKQSKAAAYNNRQKSQSHGVHSSPAANNKATAYNGHHNPQPHAHKPGVAAKVH